MARSPRKRKSYNRYLIESSIEPDCKRCRKPVEIVSNMYCNECNKIVMEREVNKASFAMDEKLNQRQAGIDFFNKLKK